MRTRCLARMRVFLKRCGCGNIYFAIGREEFQFGRGDYGGLSGGDKGEIKIAVGTHIAMRPPHKTGRAAFPHPAPTSGV